MKKKSLLALILVASLLLSGCTLVTTDTVADYARTVLEVNGHTVTKYDFLNTLNSYAENIYNYYYQQYGTDPTTIGLTNKLLYSQAVEYAKTDYVNNFLELDKAKELGLDQMSEEDQAKIAETAAEYYEMVKEQVAENYLVGSTNTGDALMEEAEEYIKSHKEVRSYDSCVELATESVMTSKVREYMVKDITVTDEQVKEVFDTTVETQKTSYEENISAYSNDVLTGSDIYYVPAGYRMVKHILIKLGDVEAANMNNATTALNNAKNDVAAAQDELDNAAEDADIEALTAALTEAQAALEAAQTEYDAVKGTAFATIQEKADDILAQAKAGETSFEALITEYSEDNMPADGYPICEGNTAFVSEFVEAGMALENIGDVSDLVASSYGYHIIQYSADVEEGAIDFETVKEALYESELTNAQDTAYDEILATWTSAAKIMFYEDRLGLNLD